MYWHKTAAFPLEIDGKEHSIETPIGVLRFIRPRPGFVRIEAGPYDTEQEARSAYEILMSYFIIAQVDHELFTYIQWPIQELQDAPELCKWPPGMNPWAPKWPDAPTSLKAAFSCFAHVVPDHEHVIEQESMSIGQILQDVPTVATKIADAARQFVQCAPERAKELAFFFSEGRAATKTAAAGSLVQITRFQNDISLLETLAPTVPVSEATNELVERLLSQLAADQSAAEEDDGVDIKYVKDTLERARMKSIGRGLRLLMRNLFDSASPGPEFVQHFESKTKAADMITGAYDLRSKWTHGMRIPAEHIEDGSWVAAVNTARIAAKEALRQYVVGN